eukprot:1160210-Pelagomonas_calceolata.AAC.4
MKSEFPLWMESEFPLWMKSEFPLRMRILLCLGNTHSCVYVPCKNTIATCCNGFPTFQKLYCLAQCTPSAHP